MATKAPIFNQATIDALQSRDGCEINGTRYRVWKLLDAWVVEKYYQALGWKDVSGFIGKISAYKSLDNALRRVKRGSENRI